MPEKMHTLGHGSLFNSPRFLHSQKLGRIENE